MNVREAIRARRSIKRFDPRPVTREDIEALLEAAALAPNHRLTQPWRFYVLGPEARYAYGLALGERKARKLDDPDRARVLRDTVAQEHRDLPLMIAVGVVNADDPEIREEDYAATMMAVQNVALAAVDLGLGTHIKTGGVMSDPAARAAAGVRDNERIVAIVNVGTPLETPPEKRREPASSFTNWIP
ncbi:MAG TPA: nitroreductase [Gemmatimonadaceae bacterium]|jgi:nitroreductase|nr:nitroreductase [Gemmatimonadaceae bacterium]